MEKKNPRKFVHTSEKKLLNLIAQNFVIWKQLSRKNQGKNFKGMEDYTISTKGPKFQQAKVQKKNAERQIQIQGGDQVLEVQTNSTLSPKDSCYSTTVRDSLSIYCEPGLSITPTPEGLHLRGRFKKVQDSQILCT